MIRPRARDRSRSGGRDAVLEGVVNIQYYSDFDMIKQLVMSLNASKLPERSGSDATNVPPLIHTRYLNSTIVRTTRPRLQLHRFTGHLLV